MVSNNHEHSWSLSGRLYRWYEISRGVEVKSRVGNRQPSAPNKLVDANSVTQGMRQEAPATIKRINVRLTALRKAHVGDEKTTR